MADPKKTHEAIDTDGQATLGMPLKDTIENTGEGLVDDDAVFAKGSRADSDLEVAPTLLSDSGGAGGRAAKSLLKAGGQLGRLQIGSTLGDGAFGVVVSAYDPELKRKLALKILKPEVFDSAGGQDAQKRLLREARAMARIEHPNVVTVHDIGAVDGQVFIAMQFVEGGNLRSWLAQEKRDQKTIVETFVKAGAGLVAAHREGLVHRDFKPDNVLVSKTGEVRVADFGLVSISDRGEERVSSTEFATGRQVSEDLNITCAGALMGTALYMAPEQHRGEEATAASDQFAFCVALYWALCGAQPFEGKNYKELRSNVLAGRLKEPPTTATIPRWLAAALRKGLSVEASERHESIQALLAILQVDRAALRRRRLRYGAAGLIGAALLAGIFLSRGAKNNPCANAEDRLEGVWDASARARLQGVFEAADRGPGFAGLASSLDRYTGDWVSVHTRVCEATHLLGEQSDSLLDQRMVCLDQRLNYLRELVEQVHAKTSREILDKALRVATDLPALDACTGAQVVGANAPLPADPEQREAINRLDAVVDKAQALSDLGEFKPVLELLGPAIETPVVYDPTMARATHLYGKTRIDVGELDEGEALLKRSIEHGSAVGDDLLVARSWLALMHLSGVEREDYAAGHQRGEMARLAMVRGKAGPLAMASIDKATATLLSREGKVAEAIALLEKALPVYEERAAKPELAALLASLGDALTGDSKYQEAVRYYRLSLAHLESSLGKTHPENIYVLNNLAVALKGQLDIEGARQALQTSLAAIEASYGPENRDVVTVLNNLGNIERREGNLEDAKATFARAIRVGKAAMEPGHPLVTKAMMNLAIVYATGNENALATETFREVLRRTEASFAEDHPDTAMALNNLGESLLLEEKYQEALGYVIRASEMKARLYGPDHPRRASSLATLGTIYKGLEQWSQAEAQLARALAIYLEAAGEKHPRTITVLSELGRLHLEFGPARLALPYLERAIAARGDEGGLAQAEDQFALVRALWQAKRVAEALAAAKALQPRLDGIEQAAELRDSLRQWLQSHS